MPTLNKVMIMGHMGGDPEVRSTQDGKSVANISIATTFGTGDNKKTEWHKVIVWEKSAEFVKEYCRKGDLVFVDGRIQTRSYDKDGQKVYVTEIVASNLLKLSGKSEGGAEKNTDDCPF